MFQKKMILAGTAAVLVCFLSVFPVSAHGHHGGHHGNRTTETVPDSNDNTGIAGNAGADLSTGTYTNADTAAVPNAYPVCNLEGCTITGHHLHDGSYYCGYHHESGYCDGSCISSSPAAGNTPASGAYPVCTFEGCTVTGHHLHDGSYYCGYYHEGGYCDGSCIGSSPAVSNTPASGNPSAASGCNYVRKHGCRRSYARKLFYCH